MLIWSHDCDHRAAGHVVAVVDWIAGTNPFEEYVMFHLIGIAASLPAPFVFAGDDVAGNISFAFAAQHDAGRVIVTTGGGPAEGINHHAVGKFIHDRMMVKHVAVDRFGHGRASAQTVTFESVLVLQRPTGTVEVVDQ